MPKRHVVSEGECISSIALEHGFFRETLENHAENAELRRQRKDLNALMPGDVVFIPDKRERVQDCSTGSKHVFRLRGIPERFRVRFVDRKGKPRAGVGYTLDVDGVRREGQTDADGWMDERAWPTAAEATVELHGGDVPEVYRFLLRRLPPLDEVAGIKARLRNLGFYGGKLDQKPDDAMLAALQRFQASRGLRPTGAADPDTLAALDRSYATGK